MTIREVDLQRKFHWTPTSLANKLKLTRPRALALRRYLGIDDDPNCLHDFLFGSQRHVGYSDNALTKMQGAMETVDMQDVWREYAPTGRRGRGNVAESA